MKKFSVAADMERVQNLYMFEDETRAKGFNLIAGVDEAGRGSLVGAVVVAAVILPGDIYLERLDDSKKISAKIRETLYEKIISAAISVAHVEVPVAEIDTLNIYQATLEGMKRAVAKLNVQPDFVLTDAMKVDFGEKIPSRSIIHGDALSASIVAASIIAKVTRDRLADQWALQYPQYGFEHNRGYGTAEHLAAIDSRQIKNLSPLDGRFFLRGNVSVFDYVSLENFAVVSDVRSGVLTFRRIKFCETRRNFFYRLQLLEHDAAFQSQRKFFNRGRANNVSLNRVNSGLRKFVDVTTGLAAANADCLECRLGNFAVRCADCKFARALQKFVRETIRANVSRENRDAPFNAERAPTDCHGVYAIFRLTRQQNSTRQSLHDVARVIERINLSFQCDSSQKIFSDNFITAKIFRNGFNLKTFLRYDKICARRDSYGRFD